jgi:hypothetical protein
VIVSFCKELYWVSIQQKECRKIEGSHLFIRASGWNQFTINGLKLVLEEVLSRYLLISYFIYYAYGALGAYVVERQTLQKKSE